MNPFKLTEPSCISFSGGRTSAYMLWRFIDANDGLPDDCIVTFANTGKEAEETLEFVRDCGKYWNVPIVWLEYQWAEETKDRFKVVDFDTAARNGEPFEQMLKAKKYLPSPVQRFCTVELKIRTISNYHFSIGMTEKRAHLSCARQSYFAEPLTSLTAAVCGADTSHVHDNETLQNL